MKKHKIFESREVEVNDVNFTFYVDTDPLKARLLPKTSLDLDKLDTEESVEKTINAIEDKLKTATGIKWTHDPSDPGAGYSFIPNPVELAASIEAKFK